MTVEVDVTLPNNLKQVDVQDALWHRAWDKIESDFGMKATDDATIDFVCENGCICNRKEIIL
jgi:hypothetical protein